MLFLIVIQPARFFISGALYLTQIIYQQNRASCKELTEEWRIFTRRRDGDLAILPTFVWLSLHE